MDIAAQIVKFNSQTNGRDKLCRVFQYASKFVWWYLDRLKRDPDLIQKLKTLETQLSSTRKVLRFGKSVDMLQGALKSMYIDDSVIRFALTMSKLNQSAYLLLDHFVWLGKVGMVKTNTKYMAKVSARFWLVTIMFNLIRNFYDIMKILSHEEKRKARVQKEIQNGAQNINVGERNMFSCLSDNKPVVVDTVKNVCDLFLPLSSLGYINTSPGTQGIMGMISSAMGILTVWDPVLKLSPA